MKIGTFGKEPESSNFFQSEICQKKIYFIRDAYHCWPVGIVANANPDHIAQRVDGRTQRFFSPLWGKDTPLASLVNSSVQKLLF